MRYFYWIIILPVLLLGQTPSGDDILRRVDQNMVADNKIIMSRMIVHGERATRTMEMKSWQRGVKESFTEFLAPPRDKGTKMLKLENNLWTYSPATDRTILISGHMLRQSMMGSDLSYEDTMEDPHLPNIYSAKVSGEEIINGRPCWILDLAAKKEDIAYYSRKIWADKSRFIILRESLFARSGRLLKTLEVREIMQVQGHWLAKSALYKDVLKGGQGTEFLIDSIELNAAIPDYIFNKASLKK